jgi:3-deoxy-D-manno-octulosonate 8-phosphate phosphatase (KDO 8-P phosphatase)
MNYKEKLHHITTFIFDVDGVLTDGKIILHPSGEQLRTMNVKDGMAIRTALSKGYKIAIISGGKSKGLIERFKHLKIDDVYLGCDDKKDALKDFKHIHNIESKNILYMGDDINDLEVMKEVGLGSCPQDAVAEIKSIADYISHKNGGSGCVRDVIEQTLKVQGKW